MSGLQVGLDIGGSKVLGVAVDGGVVLATARSATRPGAVGVVDTAERVVRELSDRVGVPAASVDVGVGVPGLVDPDRGLVLHAVNVGIGPEGLALGEALRARLGGPPVVVENDVNAAAYGASRTVDLPEGLDPVGVDAVGLAGMGLDGVGSDGLALDGWAREPNPPDVAYLSIGTGLAAGLVLGGRLRRGAFGAAGEIGHLPVDPRGAACPCGQRGCLETVASGSALARAWPVDDGTPPAQSLFAAAARGDARAGAVVTTFADAVAAAVRVLTLTVDVRSVVLGGGVAEIGPPLLDAVVEALHRQAGATPFLLALDLPGRVSLVPRDRPVAALGAAMLARSGGGRRRADDVPGSLVDGRAGGA
ncbi:ROK family protein [Thalassiella azotivora]